MYIAQHLDAEHSPKAMTASLALGIRPDQFIDCVMIPVWKMAARVDKDGVIPNITNDVLGQKVHIDESTGDLLEILVKTGWMEHTDGVYRVHDWHDHQPFFKERKRKREWAANRRQVASSSSYPTLSSGDESQKKREDKKREENTKKKSAVDLTIPHDLSQYSSSIEDWLEYKKARRQTPKTAGAATGMWNQMRKMGGDLPAAIEAAMASNWQGFHHYKPSPEEKSKSKFKDPAKYYQRGK